MPFRYPGAKRSSFTRNAGLAALPGQRDYSQLSTAIRRHEYNTEVESTSLAAGEYTEVPIFRFRRSFSASVDDSPPNPVAGNNYQTPSIFNGSRLQRYNGKVTIRSNEGVPATGGSTVQSYGIDVYEIAVSFYEAHTWNALAPTLSPIDFDTSSTNEGEADFKATPISFSSNNYKNSKFAQHYMKHLGRIVINAGETKVININRIPAKCRRANVGMFWGLILHNDAVINGGGTFDCNIHYETSFEELPSENRLPWLN